MHRLSSKARKIIGICIGAFLALAISSVGYALADTSGTSSASCGAVNTTTGTAPCTGQFSVDVPVPTQTVTQTVTETVTPPPPPPPTTTPPPPPSGSFAPGEDVHASNTGYAGDGLTASQLTPVSGSVTYGTSFNGQTISGKAYTGTVTITGSNITVKDCSLSVAGSSAFGFDIYGTNNKVDHCTITSSGENYEGAFTEPSSTGAQITNDDISHGENLITTYGASPVIANNFLHASCGCGDPDGIEVYGGSNIAIHNNRLDYNGATESPINIAPWGSYKVQGVDIEGNFLDYGQAMLLVDNQNTSCGGGSTPVGDCLINVVVKGNAMGGHTLASSQGFGRYKALENYENRTIANTDAAETANPNDIEWPTSGAGMNQWEETQTAPALTPNRDGQVALPTCPDTC